MNAHYNNKKLLIGGAIATLVLLPGCAFFDMFKSKPKEETEVAAMEVTETSAPLTGEVVVTMNGKPAITTDILQMEKENIFKSNPQVKAALAFMDPKVLDRNLTDGLISQMVVDKAVAEQGLDQSAEYKSELADAYKAIKRMLNAKYFGQTFKVSVSDDEARKFYETNKDTMPGLLLSQGGVVASGIQFDSEETARDFMNRVKSQQNDLRKVAQQEGIVDSIVDFKMVNAQSIGIDAALRDKIAAIKTVPSVEMMNVNGTIWVINATAKETAKHRPFEQIKEGIKQELEKNKRGELFEVEINRLKDKYNVKVNEDYFKSAEMPEGGEEMSAVVAPKGSATADAAPRPEAVSKRVA